VENQEIKAEEVAAPTGTAEAVAAALEEGEKGPADAARDAQAKFARMTVVRSFFREKNLLVSGEVAEAIEAKIESILNRASDLAKANNRKTIRQHDFL